MDQVEAFDLATGEFHLKTNLFGSEMFCTVHHGPVPLLAGYTKDNLAALETELKGTIEEIELREGEGVIDATYAAFFPNGVVGVVRCSVKSPGAASLAHWISMFTEFKCIFPALPKANALAGLEGPGDDVIGVTLKAKSRLLTRIMDARPDVAGALQAASKVSNSTKVGLTFATASKQERAAWWPGMRAAINDLADADLLPEFETATVNLSGREAVNLRDAYVSRKEWVQLQKKRRIGPAHAAQALVEAYHALEQGTILPSVEAWRTTRNVRRPRRATTTPPMDGDMGQLAVS